jgi:outer membrane immunogenic protein
MGVAAFLTATVLAPSLSEAADYPVLRGTQTEDVPPAPSEVFGSFEWTGFYFGGGAGQSQTRFETDRGIYESARFAFQGTSIGTQFRPDELVTSLPKRDSGTTFFGFAGYNIAFGEAVVGIEGDYSRLEQGVTAATSEARRIGNEYVVVSSNQDVKLSDYFSARLRFGYAIGRIMPYFTVGAATGRFTTNTFVTADWGPTDANGFRAGSYVGWPRTIGGPKKDTWGYGGVIGGGIEAALTDNLLVRAEYLYTRFDNVEGVTASLNTARVAAALKF